jgi:hypothetical protein
MIVSPCSSRKKAPAAPGLHAATLTTGLVDDVARQWKSSLRAASQEHTSYTLYGGRAFTEAALAAKSANAPHYFLSAGLGLVGPDEKIPAYAMTTVGSTDENVLRKCPQGTTAADWWKKALSPGALADLIDRAKGRVLLALPSVYLEMVQDELLCLSSCALTKVRIFTAGSATLRSSPIDECVMPYDARLDGPDSPIPGTKSDFASRALRHFVEIACQSEKTGLSGDKVLAANALAGMRMPTTPKRVRVSDSDIREALIAAWDHAQGNRQRLLRHLRDVLLMSCEQSRFARIARELEEERMS